MHALMWSKKRNLYTLFLCSYNLKIIINFQHKHIYAGDSFSFCSCCMSPSILHFRAVPLCMLIILDAKRSPVGTNKRNKIFENLKAYVLSSFYLVYLGFFAKEIRHVALFECSSKTVSSFVAYCELEFEYDTNIKISCN
jgi:hypothetical protein